MSGVLRTAAVTAAAVLGLAACGSSTTSEPAAAASSAVSVSPTPSPSDTSAQRTFTLAADSRVYVGDSLPTLTATRGGRLTTSPQDGGGTRFVAAALDKRGQPVWTLTLGISQLGRAADGTLVLADGRSWVVTPQTGVLVTEPAGSATASPAPTTASFRTQRAVTLTLAPAPGASSPANTQNNQQNVPMTFVVGGSGG
jgi:hypothetical protein